MMVFVTKLNVCQLLLFTVTYFILVFCHRFKKYMQKNVSFRNSKFCHQSGEWNSDLQQLWISTTHNPLVHLSRGAWHVCTNQTDSVKYCSASTGWRVNYKQPPGDFSVLRVWTAAELNISSFSWRWCYRIGNRVIKGHGIITMWKSCDEIWTFNFIVRLLDVKRSKHQPTFLLWTKFII